ncbi:MAG TPA: hypothetical protein VFD55_02275 [Candidatus Angelobacter sp.]|nr:hypothetical protein [Candidatus Angelobacter sp.]
MLEFPLDKNPGVDDKGDKGPKEPPFNVTEGQIDDFVHKGNSYDDAFRHFGIKPGEFISYEDEARGYSLPAESSDTTGGEKINRKGISVPLAQRAIDLSDSLRYYLKASRVNGFTRAVDHYPDVQKRYKPDDVTTISRSESRSRSNGDVEFLKAFGGRELVDAGIDQDEVKFAAQEDADNFVDRFTGPANKSNRAKLRKSLRWQKKIK